MRRHTSFRKLYLHVGQQVSRNMDEFQLLWRGRPLLLDDTPESMDFEEEEDLYMRSTQVGGKPVIYLFPPSALDSVQVDLTLVPEWTFSALYPLSDITRGKNGSSSTSWTVAASPEGNLVDKASSLSLCYLALTSLSLHTSARNDFITYWLPSFIRIHERGHQIAFRFLEQAAYEQAARLQVEPKPDVVTRVFLLFKGVKEEESEGWRKAEEVDWVKKVGVEQSKFGDEKLFRVLEWGGMEVLA
ncbi:hypothetical protein BCR35DRAFT_329864 [Leucosporidium creatinivorum]|uniref:Uncharacterized protein n=1 Tax=Leucosporidium creatinivorum TaxID=106004 RepID=A0A1Y2FYJ0_9BASI|nr:hypothetical protein BCR35DRAFT_329864 [Leucosporidium creatinivorum]